MGVKTIDTTELTTREAQLKKMLRNTVGRAGYVTPVAAA